MLCGGAGIGKSVLLEQVFSPHEGIDSQSCVFIRFMDRDKTSKEFLKRLAFAFGFCAIPRLDEASFLADFIKKTVVDKIIVIDDFHDFGEHNIYSNFLAELIALTTCPGDAPPIRWVVAIRNQHNLPQGSWLASNRATLIDADVMLSVTDQEIENYCESHGIKSFKHKGIFRSLMLNASLIIAEKMNLRREDAPYPEDKIFRHRDQTAFLKISKLITNLEASLHIFLYSTCLLDEIDLDDLLESEHINPSALKKLSSLGIIHYDAVLEGLRYDSSVSHFLKSTLQYCSMPVIVEATKIASHVGSRRSDVMLGFSILSEHQAWDSIVEILKISGLFLLDHEPVHGSVEKALSKLPIEVAQNDPFIAGLWGVMTARVGFSDVSESWFQNALFSEQLSGHHRRTITFRYALEVARRERNDAFSLLEPLYQELESDPLLDPDLRALVRVAMSVVSIQNKRTDDAIMYSISALEADSYAFNDSTHARVHHGAAYTYLRAGHPFDSSPLADKAIHFAEADGSFELASWCLSLRQEIAHRFEHDFNLTLSYLRKLEFCAWLSEDARMMLIAALGIYWIALELGDQKLMAITRHHIDRYEAIDDYMQTQIRGTIVPGSAYTKAWQGEYDKAAHLIEIYAPRSHKGHNQAYRWSELAIYYSASYHLSQNIETRTKAYAAMVNARDQLKLIEHGLDHENDILTRLCIAAVLLERFTLANSIILLISGNKPHDWRTPALFEAMEALLEYWQKGESTARLRPAVRGLMANQMGAIAYLIGGLPRPHAAVRYEAATLAELT